MAPTLLLTPSKSVSPPLHHLDPSADATSISEISTSSAAVTPVPAPKLAFAHRNKASAAALARPEAESNLVLETTECGMRRHYLIPHHLEHVATGKKRRNRGRKSSGGGTASAAAAAASLLSKQLAKTFKGTKLHLAMEHVFVARNVKGYARVMLYSPKAFIHVQL